MKKILLIVFPLLITSCEAFSQEQDAVMYSMYRYHPKEAILNMKVDSVFIQTVKEDTTFLYGIIVYDTLGRESKYIDVESGFEYRMDYYPTGLLKSSRIIDYDHGLGPVDSFVYNKRGALIRSYNGMNQDYDITKYKYKKGKLINEIGESYSTKYTYKNGRRVLNTFYANKNKVIQSQKIYEYNEDGNLNKIFENGSTKWLNFHLFYNERNLLTTMKVYGEDLKLGQQYNTYYDDNGLITYRKWYLEIKNNDLENCEYQEKVYSYSYRN